MGTVKLHACMRVRIDTIIHVRTWYMSTTMIGNSANTLRDVAALGRRDYGERERERERERFMCVSGGWGGLEVGWNSER